MRQLLIKYRENKCNVQELGQVLAYLKTKEGQQQLALLMDKDTNSIVYSDEDGQEATDYDALFAHIQENIAGENQQSKTRHFRLSRRQFAVAATISSLLVLAIAWLVMGKNDPTIYQTAYGETQSITLPDGSVVTLNANSSLKTHSDFDKQREVWLKGEAFFVIEKLKREAVYAKFIVHTDRLKVEVLGTSFNVQDWEEKTRVVLRTGKVKLTSEDNENMLMEPGELAEISSDSKTILKKVVNPEIYAAWTENKLLCDNTPLSELAIVIEHRYGKQVIFEDASLMTLAVSGTLPLANLTTLIEILKESLKINITTHEGALTVREQKSKPVQ